MEYCTSCGRPIPDGQGSSCSMCYGDPWYGRDGYAMEELRRQEEQHQIERQYEEEWERIRQEEESQQKEDDPQF